MKVCDLIVGQKATLDLVLGECSIRKTKGNPPRDFLAATLTDGVDKLDGKIWNYDARKGVPELGKVYTITGQIGEYLGKKQVTIDTMELSIDQSVDRFEPMYIENASEVYDDCLNMIGAMSPGALRDITECVYKAYRAEIISATSAKGVHHMGHGGNVAHTYEVAGLAAGISNVLNKLGYQVNRDLAVAGALLHDLGKCWTYSIEGAVIDYARLGRELDHIVIGELRLMEVIERQLPNYKGSKELAALMHIIASHHGELEYGSPVTPLFMEAYIVHYADKISADMNVLGQANAKAIAEGKAMTDKLFVLHNREHVLQRDVL